MAIFAKLAPDIRRHPKCRKAGRDGTDVFIHALCVNAARGATGIVPAAYLEPWFIRDEVQFDNDEQAAEGLRRAVVADLIVMCPDGSGHIVGWDDEEWGRGARDEASMTEAERKRQQREREREERRALGSTGRGVSGHVRTASGRPDHGDEDGDKKEREREKEMESGDGAPAIKPDPILTVQEPKAKPQRKTAPHAMPDDFAPSDAHRAFATAHDLSLERELGKFTDHHKAKGSTFASWPHAFSKWLGNADEYRRRDGPRGPAPPQGGAPPTAARGGVAAAVEIARRKRAEEQARHDHDPPDDHRS